MSNRFLKVFFYQKSIAFNKTRLSIKTSTFSFLKTNDLDFDTSSFKKSLLIIDISASYLIDNDFELTLKSAKVIRFSSFLNSTNLHFLKS